MARGKSRFRQKKSIKPRYRNQRQVKTILAQRLEAVQEEMENKKTFGEAKINKKKSLKELLRSWVNCHGITTRAVNDLLGILVAASKIKFAFIHS